MKGGSDLTPDRRQIQNNMELILNVSKDIKMGMSFCFKGSVSNGMCV